ncbi:MAG TPA: fatty acyl-CoA synthetase [Nocardioides sp.]
MTATAPETTARRQGVAHLVHRSAARFPRRTALVDGDVSWTFAELAEIVDRTATALDAAGLRRGERVALLAHNCWQYPVLVLAAARIGAVAVPLNFMLGPAEVRYILDDADAVALVAEDALLPVAQQALDGAGTVRTRAVLRLDPDTSGTALPDGWVDVDTWTSHPEVAPPDVELEDDEPVRIMYTSGTESRPKGVVLSSRSLMWQYVSCVATGGMEASDVEVHALPLYHCAQLDNFLMTDLYLGATSIVLRRPEPEAILAAVERHRATNLFCPPTVWIGLLASPAFATADLGSLRKGYYGASAMPLEMLDTLGERFPDLRLWNFYGQTEMASLATALPPEEQRTHGGSAGYPALNVETRIVDPDGTPLPTGAVGEIVHRSPHLTLGYLNQPAKTAEAFRGGWFHSGDLGYLDPDGRLYVVDRVKDMIKSGGENVASREVEEVLYRHPEVAEAAVFGVPDDHWIEAVTAAVVLRPDAEVTPDALRAHCRAVLAGFKTPRAVHVVSSLPKNPSGKILKRELRESFTPARRS